MLGATAAAIAQLATAESVAWCKLWLAGLAQVGLYLLWLYLLWLYLLWLYLLCLCLLCLYLLWLLLTVAVMMPRTCHAHAGGPAVDDGDDARPRRAHPAPLHVRGA